MGATGEARDVAAAAAGGAVVSAIIGHSAHGVGGGSVARRPGDADGGRAVRIQHQVHRHAGS